MRGTRTARRRARGTDGSTGGRRRATTSADTSADDRATRACRRHHDDRGALRPARPPRQLRHRLDHDVIERQPIMSNSGGRPGARRGPANVSARRQTMPRRSPPTASACCTASSAARAGLVGEPGKRPTRVDLGRNSGGLLDPSASARWGSTWPARPRCAKSARTRWSFAAPVPGRRPFEIALRVGELVTASPGAAARPPRRPSLVAGSARRALRPLRSGRRDNSRDRREEAPRAPPPRPRCLHHAFVGTAVSSRSSPRRRSATDW